MDADAKHSSTVGHNGLVRVQSNAQIDAEAAQKSADKDQNAPQVLTLSSHIESVWEENRNHKQSSGISDRMLNALQQRDATYDSMKRAAIQAQGGSDVFISLTSVKCRAAEAWLTDVMNTAGEKSWGLEPTPLPELDPSVEQAIVDRVMAEWQMSVMSGAGRAMDQMEAFQLASNLRDRIETMMQYEATKCAERMETKIDDQLTEGKWNDVLEDVITDLVTLPVGILKCPVVRKRNSLTWPKGAMGRRVPKVEEKIVLEVERVSPFDYYPAPGAVEINDGSSIEICRFQRKDLVAMKGVDRYDSGAIDLVLRDYSAGLLTHWEPNDEERAIVENTGTRHARTGANIQGLEFWGSVQGQYLIDRGMTKTPEGETIEELGEYEMNAIMVGRYIIYADFNADPLGRRPYYKSSWAKAPGSFWGKGVPELMSDLQRICNASVRSLVNNMGWSAGPQAVISDTERIAPGEDIESIFPAKIWQFINPSNSQVDPLKFFDIPSNAQELIGVYEQFAQLADDFTGIPAYAYGNDQVAGAGRTASGLSMLMSSAARGIKLVILGVDKDLISPAIQRYFEWNMAFDPDETIKGDMRIKPIGVLAKMMKEQLAARRIEFLQATANPIDSQIMGMERRGNVLRGAAHALEMPTDDVVPPKHELAALQAEMGRRVAAENEGTQLPQAA